MAERNILPGTDPKRRYVPTASLESPGRLLTLVDIWALRGSTNCGDSIADEWVIVHILQQISKQHFDVWIRVYDTDGEFLLIEAANVLPKWIKPEISENRVRISASY